MNKNCSASGKNKFFEHKVLPAVYISVFFFGLVTNTWGLKSLLQKWKKLGNINIFVLNLGVTNVFYLPILPFLAAYYLMENMWIFGDAFCKITRFCFNLNLYGSIGFLTCISVYRYLALVHPMRVMGRITVTQSMAISVMVWSLVSIQSLPDMFFTKNYKNNTKKCFHTTSKEFVQDYLKYSLGWTITGFFIPLIITLGCYGQVTVVLCRKNTIDKVLRVKSFVLLFILVLLFSVCYIPYHVFKNLSLYSRVLLNQRICPEWDNAVMAAHQISRCLVCLNSALNPLVYLQVHDISARFRQRAREIFYRWFLSGSVAVAQSADEV